MRSFSPRLALRALWQMRVRRRPFVLSHGITARCNLSCRFCEYWKGGEREMSTPEVLSLLDEAKAFGIGVYNAWTAEPLLREDLPQILGYAKKLGLITSMVTNGKLLQKRAHELSHLDYLSVSVDGIESFSRLREIELQKVLDGIDAAQKHGHEILINCVISRANLEELGKMVKLAQELGVWISFEPIHHSEGIDPEVWEELRIKDPDPYRKGMDELIEMKKQGAPIINSFTYLQMIRSMRPQFRCHANQIIMHVAADGTVLNCRGQSDPLGQVSEGLLKVWRASLGERQKITRRCQGCLFFGYVENSLLYDLVPEVMAHYEWM